MLPRAQGLQWSHSTACRGKARLLTVRAARNFSSLPRASARANLQRSQTGRTNLFLSSQQTRSISWTGWWSSKPDPTSAAPATEASIDTSAQHILDDKGPVSAPYKENDTSELLNTEQPKPEILEKVEDALLAPPEGVEEAVDISQIPERIGYLTEVCGLQYWYGPTATVQWVMEHIHIWGSVPWAVTIISTAVLIRLATVKWIIGAQKMGIKMRKMQPIIQPLKEEYRVATLKGDRKRAMEVGAQMREVHKEAGVKMLDGFKPVLIQIPLTFGGFRTLRNASELPVPTMESESFLWLDSLTQGDPWILPLLIGAMTYRTMSKSAAQMAGGAGPAQGVLLLFRYLLPVMSVVFCHYQALAAQLWFLTMTGFSQLQVTLLANQRFRDYFDLGPVATPKLQQPPPPTDAFGYRTDVQLGGMNVRKQKGVIDVKAKPAVPEEASIPQPEVSRIDKMVDAVKAKFKSETKDTTTWLENRRKQKEESFAQKNLDQYELQAMIDNEKRREKLKHRNKAASDDDSHTVGGMRLRGKQ